MPVDSVVDNISAQPLGQSLEMTLKTPKFEHLVRIWAGAYGGYSIVCLDPMYIVQATVGPGIQN